MQITRLSNSRSVQIFFGPSSVEDVSYGVSVGFVDADVGAFSAVHPLLDEVVVFSWDACALVKLAFGSLSRHTFPSACNGP